MDMDDYYSNDDESPLPKVQRLDTVTSSTLRRGQVITKLSDVVRELIDNSIDARCSRVQVLLEDYGVKQIEVRDDGQGIPADQFHNAIAGGYTSKLVDDELLSCNADYGFRGEALSSICSFSTVSILTKTSSDQYGTRYHLNANGKVTASSPGPISKGTHVRVTELFAKYPVRRKFIQEKGRKQGELKEIESYVKTCALANPSVRVLAIHFAIIHEGRTIWTKPSVVGLEQAITLVFGIFISRDLTKLGPVAISTSTVGKSASVAAGSLSTIEVFTPRAPIDPKLMTLGTNKWTIVFVNRRRVYIKEFEKMLQNYVEAATENSGTKRFPICILKIQTPPDQVDFNRDIDKSKVFLLHQTKIASKLNEMLADYYKVDISNLQDNSRPNKRLKGLGQQPLSNVNRDVDSVAVAVVPTATVPKVNVTTTENRNDNVMSFLENIPSRVNFSHQSPTKLPDRRIVSSTIADSRVILDENSIQPRDAEVPKTPTPTNDTAAINKDWIYGRLRDRDGNVIESTTLFTGGMAKQAQAQTPGALVRRFHSPDMGIRTVPTTPVAAAMHSQHSQQNNLYSPAPTPKSKQSLPQTPAADPTAREKYQEFLTKVANCHMTPTNFQMTESQPSQRKAKTPLFNQPANYEDIIMTPASAARSSQQSQGLPRKPRQVTLDCLRNWKMPPSQPRSAVTANSSGYSSIASSSSENFPPKIPDAVRTYLGSGTLRQKGLFELNSSVSINLEDLVARAAAPVAAAAVTPPPEPEPPEEIPTRIIAPLPGSTTIYLVKVGTMLGAFSPINMLEMEPALKILIGISPFEVDPNAFDLSIESVASLLQEFTTLSCEDYSEEQVRKVFHLLKDVGQI